jgi:enoyl-CoA hydratase/carnithine racemase
MTDLLKTERLDHTAVLTLDNPPANTWNRENLTGLKALVEKLNADRDVYALVVTGQGEKFFSAGADVNLFADGDAGVARQMADLFGQAFETLARFRGISIAAINGYAMGGGLECALACDLRVAEEQAVMALPEASIGLLPCGGGTQNLPWVVGEAWAKRIICCGERVTAEQALEIGLVEEVVAKGGARNAAVALAAKVAAQSPVSAAKCKQLIQRARSQPQTTALAPERDAFVELFATEDQREGVNAFLQKRKPQWRNR